MCWGLALVPDTGFRSTRKYWELEEKTGPARSTDPAFWILVGGAEFESATPWMSTKYSNQLN